MAPNRTVRWHPYCVPGVGKNIARAYLARSTVALNESRDLPGQTDTCLEAVVLLSYYGGCSIPPVLGPTRDTSSSRDSSPCLPHLPA